MKKLNDLYYLIHNVGANNADQYLFCNCYEKKNSPCIAILTITVILADLLIQAVCKGLQTVEILRPGLDTHFSMIIKLKVLPPKSFDPIPDAYILQLLTEYRRGT